MLANPRSGSEWRQAIVEHLAPGEELLNFSDILRYSVKNYDDGSSVIDNVWWGVVVLTNVNLRIPEWDLEVVNKGFSLTATARSGFKKQSFAFIPKIHSVFTLAINDIKSFSYREDLAAHALVKLLCSFEPCHFGFPNESSSGNQLKLRPKDFTSMRFFFSELMTIHRSGPEDDAYFASPFREFAELIKNFEAVKSGTYLAANASNAANALDQLAPLLKDGVITQEEFDRAKDGFLGTSVEIQTNSIDSIRQLHALHKSGVLSEMEFNMKKWDILSKSN